MVRSYSHFMLHFTHMHHCKLVVDMAVIKCTCISKMEPLNLWDHGVRSVLISEVSSSQGGLTKNKFLGG